MRHDVIYLTQEGYEQKRQELEHLVKVRRPQVLERIKTCQDRGDLEEEGGDTEFQEAQREQDWVESRIEELRKILAVSEILQLGDIPLDRVGVGTVVHLRDLDTGEKRLCQIVTGVESDPANKKISAESPVGAALLDKVRGETVEAKIPAGVKRYKILRLGAELPPARRARVGAVEKPTKPVAVAKPKPVPAAKAQAKQPRKKARTKPTATKVSRKAASGKAKVAAARGKKKPTAAKAKAKAAGPKARSGSKKAKGKR